MGVHHRLDWTELRGERSIRLARRMANALRVHDRSGSKAVLDFQPVHDAHLGLSLRWLEARRRVLTSLQGQATRSWIGDTLLLEIEALSGDLRLGEVIECSAYALVLPASCPLTPRLVLSALPISPQERLRWTKDGRLPRSGAVMMLRAHPVSVATYAVETISALVENPSIIALWREQDASRAYATG
jgi:hypothetical protein